MALTRQALPDEAAIAYVRNALSQGRGLSRRLVGLDLTEGQVWTYLRPDVSLEYASAHLNETWLVATNEETEPWRVINGYRIRAKPTNLRPAFVHLIAQLMQSPRACCVFEDALANSSDPFLNKVPCSSEPYVFHAGDVFYLVDRATGTPEAITTGMTRTASTWLQNIFLTHMPPDVDHIPPHAELTDGQLSALAADVYSILVSAFDGVGYVAWEKAGANIKTQSDTEQVSVASRPR